MGKAWARLPAWLGWIWLGCAAGAVSAASAGCSDASGTVSGGTPLFDAAPPPTSALLCFPASSGPDGGADAGSGHTFSDLYRDYFGNVKGAACAGPGTGCHTDGQAGAAGSGGYTCPSNDKAKCYNGMRTAGLVTDSDKNAPEQSQLYQALRKASGGGSMPKTPACAFSASDMQRIADWVSAGAPND